jgi:hypothetical protein
MRNHSEPAFDHTAVKESAMEILFLVVALVVLDIAAQIYGSDSRPQEPAGRGS